MLNILFKSLFTIRLLLQNVKKVQTLNLFNSHLTVFHSSLTFHLSKDVQHFAWIIKVKTGVSAGLPRLHLLY